MKMLFIGETTQRGTYYFHSLQHRGWITANLDNGKAGLHDTLAMITFGDDDDNDALPDDVDKAVIGVQGPKLLIDGKDAVPILREHREAKILCVYENNGKTRVGGKLEEQLAEFARGAKKEFDDV